MKFYIQKQSRKCWISKLGKYCVLAISVATVLSPAAAQDKNPSFGLLDDPTLREAPDDVGLIFTEAWEKGKPVGVDIDRVGETYIASPERKQVDEAEPGKSSRVHPLIEEWFESIPGDQFVDIIVTIPESLIIPRFPEPDTNQSRESDVNQQALKRTGELINELQQKRRESNSELNSLLEELGGKVMNEYWIIPSVLVSIPLQSVKQLLEYGQIQYIEPAQSDELPPANSNLNDDVNDARALIQSDAYFNQGLTSGWIGLLDTGVNRAHVLLNSPDRIAIWRDCTSGDPNCFGGNPNDSCWNHGTSAAGIISGNNNQGNAQRGVSGIQIDSWKVYPDNGGNCGGLNGNATIQAFQKAVSVLDRIIVAEMQGGGSENSAISLAADAAFDTGAAVVAANGNNGSAAGTVNSPANAHRVIGVGAFDTENQIQYANQSRGPTSDGRFKPDIQMPNMSETASTGCWFGVPCSPLSNTANRVFGGTSGAVPYAGAAAALARNWMRRFSQVDPGHVYARMIVAGQNPFPFDNTQGAGRVKLPTNGYSWWGKVTVSNFETVDIPINVSHSTAHDLDGAIWWPESAASHDDIDLRIVSPNGTVMDSSVSVNSVFERVRASGGVATGTWKLRIYGYDVSGNQDVYFNATVRN